MVFNGQPLISMPSSEKCIWSWCDLWPLTLWSQHPTRSPLSLIAPML